MQSLETSRSPRWGAVATVGWSIAVFVIWNIAQFIASLATFAARDIDLFPGGQVDKQKLALLQFDGNAIAWGTCIGMLIGIAAVVAIIKLKQGARVASYLDLRRPAAASLAKWIGVMLAFLVAVSALGYVLQRPVPEFSSRILASADPKWLLWLAVVGAAPLFEEVFFRGFLFSGLQNSRVGLTGAVLISAACFVCIHAQYEPYELMVVFGLGVLFGMARHATRSLWVPITMHSLWNLIAFVAVSMEWDYVQ